MRDPLDLRFALAALASVALLVPPSAALAEKISYSAKLDGASEVPANDSKGTGSVEATYDTETMKLVWTVTYSGLTGPVTAAHFHGPAKAGENAGPAVTLPPARLASPIKGEATLTPIQAKELADRMWYLNLHTAAHQPGEIRGQRLKK